MNIRIKINTLKIISKIIKIIFIILAILIFNFSFKTNKNINNFYLYTLFMLIFVSNIFMVRYITDRKTLPVTILDNICVPIYVSSILLLIEILAIRIFILG